MTATMPAIQLHPHLVTVLNAIDRVHREQGRATMGAVTKTARLSHSTVRAQVRLAQTLGLACWDRDTRALRVTVQRVDA